MDVIIPFHCIESASIHFYQDTIFAFYILSKNFSSAHLYKASCDRLSVVLPGKTVMPPVEINAVCLGNCL